MNDFEDLQNDEPIGCVKELLQLVSRGNAIIAEINRLAELVPTPYRNGGQHASCYAELIVDFTYLKNGDQFEQRVEQQPALQSKDNELRCNYLELLQQFYSLFEAVHRYILDLNRILEELDEGSYIQQSIETLLNDTDGKQLLCESIYLCGLILLVLDFKIDGLVRERLLIAFYRYSAQETKSECNIDDVCKLIRSSGFSSIGTGIIINTSSKRPLNYPVDYFRRSNLRYEHLNLVLGRLRSDDLYGQISNYPLPEQRSTALANQAAVLFVTLFFVPEILHNQNAIMREITDKFFPDNHVISVYMGFVINLVDAWESFRAAKSALANTLDQTAIRQLASRHGQSIDRSIQQVKELLKEGNLNEELVLNGSNKLLTVLRQANVTLRWVLLHTYAANGNEFNELNGNCGRRCRQVRDWIVSESKFDPIKAFDLLICTAQLEHALRRIYKKLLTNRGQSWNQYRSECYERISELADVFSGEKPLTRIEKNEKFCNWFRQFAQQLKSLDYADDGGEHNNRTNRKIIKLIHALEQAQEFRQLENYLQVKQYLIDSDRFLHLMVKVGNISENFLLTLQTIGDLSYAWELIRIYTSHMQKGIQEDPNLVIMLRATFLKLGSALDIPLLRINQANSRDLEAVSQFYSSELVRYVRDVLHVIPESLFQKMEQIVRLQTDAVHVLPTYLRRDDLHKYAQSDERFEIARLTHSISVFTQGLLMMRTTLFGVIKIDASKILEDGIRKELVRQLAKAFHFGFIFPSKQRPGDLYKRLELLCNQMDGYRRSFEYIQDYVCIYGLKIWQEELCRLLNYNVEQECNPFLLHKVHDWESLYQSRHIPIPVYDPVDLGTVTFVGRLVKELTKFTDPKTTSFVFQMFAWYDCKTRTDVLNNRIFKLLNKSVGVPGLNGIDKLLGFMIVSELETMNKCIADNFTGSEAWIENVHKIIDNLSDCSRAVAPLDVKLVNSIANKYGRFLTFINDCLARIGQMQIIKFCIGNEVNSSCKFEANQLCQSIQTLNDAILNDIRFRPEKIEHKEESSLLFELAGFLEWNGITDTFSKVYITTKDPMYLEIICFLLLLNQIPKLMYSKQTQSLVVRRNDSNDGPPFTIGMITWLAQHSQRSSFKLLNIVGQLISSLQSDSGKGDTVINDLVTFCAFVESFAFYAKIPKAHVQKHIPSILMDCLHTTIKLQISK